MQRKKQIQEHVKEKEYQKALKEIEELKIQPVTVGTSPDRSIFDISIIEKQRLEL